jgi:hypothetical protein
MAVQMKVARLAKDTVTGRERERERERVSGRHRAHACDSTGTGTGSYRNVFCFTAKPKESYLTDIVPVLFSNWVILRDIFLFRCPTDALVRAARAQAGRGVPPR